MSTFLFDFKCLTTFHINKKGVNTLFKVLTPFLYHYFLFHIPNLATTFALSKPTISSPFISITGTDL